MAKKQKAVEVVEQAEITPRVKVRRRIRKMKYHPVTRYKGCVNCE